MSTLKRTLELGLWGFGAATPLWAPIVLMYVLGNPWVSDRFGPVLEALLSKITGISGTLAPMSDAIVQMALWALFEPAFVITGAVGVVAVAGRKQLGFGLLGRVLLAAPVGLLLAMVIILGWQILIPGLMCEIIFCYVVVSIVAAADGQRLKSFIHPWMSHPVLSGVLLLATGVANVVVATLLPFLLYGADGALNVLMGTTEGLPMWVLGTLDVSSAIVCILSSCLFAALVVHSDQAGGLP